MSNKKYGPGAKYAACILALVVVAAGITVYLTQRNNQPVQEAVTQEPLVENLAVGTQAAQPTQNSESSASVPTTLPVKAATPTQPSTQPSTQSTAATVAPSVPSVLKTALPVPGDTIGAYAMDCLSYNETTRDWRVHNGVDLAAEAGAPVGAAADGTVYTTYEDDTLGFTVVIRHDGGYTTRYSSLDENLCVKPGDAVTMGQTIGYAGDTALVESVMGAHVHFSVSYQDQDMDPAEFFAMS